MVAGREALLSCHVNHLGSYKVAWVRVDTQTILTIHNSIITRNQRVSLSHREHKEWKLHIANVQEVDRGWYMCQVRWTATMSVLTACDFRKIYNV